MRPIKIRLGEMLVGQGLLREDELPDFLAKAKQTGKKLGRVLVDAKRITEIALVQALANQLGLPFVDLQKMAINHQVVQALPETMARKWSSLVVAKNAKPDGAYEFTVAMSDPADVFVYDEISKALQGEIIVVAATEDGIFNAIDRLYRKNDEIIEHAQALTREFTDAASDALDLAQLGNNAGQDAPVVKLLQSIFEDAIAKRASDIHIEPMERRLVVRIRVDGTMHVLSESDTKIAAPLAQRLKLISGLNISERRLPQDGRFNIKVHRHIIDVRIATSPTAFGEAIVMRLLNQNAAHFDLDQLNMPPETRAAFLEAIDRPQGMILVTGPTGSGKTTSLYAALTRLNTPSIKLITVEDPVEYRIPGINQIQTHEKIGLTFNTALRSILRQDPDVILVGEMRDKETVDAALRASMTGHLVLSTLHTNDAKSAAARLIDMGAETFVVSQSLHLVLAQRLVRLICTHCSVPYKPNDHEQAWSLLLAQEQNKGQTSPPDGYFCQGKGCEQCSNTGYLGRIAIYEHLSMNRELIAALSVGLQKFSEVGAQTVQGKTLSHHANSLARQGLVTLKEARRVSYEA
jgi:MSHA biogenesis protein MshE